MRTAIPLPATGSVSSDLDVLDRAKAILKKWLTGTSRRRSLRTVQHQREQIHAVIGKQREAVSNAMRWCISRLVSSARIKY